jgi:hypothetical protein
LLGFDDSGHRLVAPRITIRVKNLGFVPNHPDVSPDLLVIVGIVGLIGTLPRKADSGFDPVALVFRRRIRNHFGHDVAGGSARPFA